VICSVLATGLRPLRIPVEDHTIYAACLAFRRQGEEYAKSLMVRVGK